MEIITGIFFVYIFISLYMLSLFLVSYFKLGKEMHSTPEITKEYSVSAIVPAYNEEDSIEETLKSITEIEYKNIKNKVY
jgi:cellulose synthase/poly-beta-1,6-N-acetylglucosamine synthase-like glycosyltransferase